VCLLAIAFLVWRHSAGQVGKDLAFIVGACGLSSVVLGTFFTGSYFGHSLRHMGWRWTLDFEPLRLGANAGTDAGDSAMRYLLLAIILGVALISLGLVLNILNRFRARDYEGMVLGRFGLAGIVFYWGVLALVIKFVVAGAGPADVWLGLLVGVPLVLVALHEPVFALLTGRRPLFHEGPLVGLFESALEVLETVMVFASNTFSFLRVAAFALSHTALCFTTFVLEDIVGQHLPLGAVWAVLVFMVGTVVIVGLEGLIVAIQVFRLEYYEFFTKFFRGEGHAFRPFRLNGGAL
jgi:V/A-type H+-transporting ATPase subunit I